MPDRQFIAKIEMAMGCRGVGREEVGVKCGCMQRCYEGARAGVRSQRSMEQVAVSTKTNRVGAAANCRCHRHAPMIEGGEPPPNGCGLGKRTQVMLGPRVGGEDMGRGNGEGIIINAMTSRYTNSTETNQRPAFSVCHTLEPHTYPHV